MWMVVVYIKVPCDTAIIRSQPCVVSCTCSTDLGCFEKLQMDGHGRGCWTKRAGCCDRHRGRGTSNPPQRGPYSWSQVGKRASPLTILWRRKPSVTVQQRSPCLSGTPFALCEKSAFIYIYTYIFWSSVAQGKLSVRTRRFFFALSLTVTI